MPEDKPPPQNALKSALFGTGKPTLIESAGDPEMAALLGAPEEEEDEKAKARAARAALTTTYIDTWTLATWKGHVRMVFGETFADLDDVFRLAIVMELQQAEDFANHLLSIVERRKAKDIERSARQAKDNDG